MLVNFSVTNFLSFNQKTTFSMESGRVTKKLDHLLIDQNTGKSLLKFSAMYGKNGAGKTNFIRAVSVLRNFILTGKLPQRAPILWCRLQDENETKPTKKSFLFSRLLKNSSISSRTLKPIILVGVLRIFGIFNPFNIIVPFTF